MNEELEGRAKTPEALLGAVSRLKQRYEQGRENIDEITLRPCYAALHPDLPPAENLDQHWNRFSLMKRVAGLAAWQQFESLQAQRTPSAVFAGFEQIRSRLLEVSILHFHQELYSIGSVQRELFPMGWGSWAEVTAASFMATEERRTRFWIKGVCDVREIDPDDVEELLHWHSWRAPRFLVMKPSRNAAYQAERAWERQDEATTAAWLERFALDVVLQLRQRLEIAAGDASVAEAKRMSVSRPAAGVGNQPAAESAARPSPDVAVEFSHSDDYRSIRWMGKTYSLTRPQATMIKTLHLAYLRGHPDVEKLTLLGSVESETSEVRDFLRKSGLWMGLVIPGSRKGTYRLHLQAQSSK